METVAPWRTAPRRRRCWGRRTSRGTFPGVTDQRPIVSAGLLRGYISVLEDRGLLESVREQASGKTRDLIDHPPSPLVWVETTIMEDMMDVLGRLHGRAMVKAVALETARTKAGPLVLPFMRTLLSLWGATPESIFKHIHRVVGIQAKGLSLTYLPESPASGTVELIYPHGTNDAVYASWEGVFRLAFEVCQVQGTIERAEVSEGGYRGRIKVHWGPGRRGEVDAPA
jgi:hypothetical protein